MTYTTSAPGPDDGLRLMLRSNQADYLPVSDTATFKIAIQEPLQEPFPDAFGYNAATGFINAFAFTRVNAYLWWCFYAN